MHISKKFISVILSIAMICFIIPFSALAEDDPFSGYTKIYTKQDLDNVRNNLSGNYVLMNDIEFTDKDFAENGDYYNDGHGWNPIGENENSAFTGTFDGNGYVIKNLYINISTTDSDVYAGFFGYYKGTIKNLGIVDGNVFASHSSISANTKLYAGGIAGYNSGIISNCYNIGSVSASHSSTSSGNNIYAGGIVGYNMATITNCYNMGSISASSSSEYSDSFFYAGGIAGYNYNNGTITNCYNTGSVSASSSFQYPHSFFYAGGIAGYNMRAITNCYNTGSVLAISSNFYVCAGGIAGDNRHEITNCYNIGTVSATSFYSNVCTGGIAGNNNIKMAGYYDEGIITNCYYLDIISKGAGEGTDTCIKLTAEQMKNQSSFVGFNFDTVWKINSKLSYLFPTLKSVNYVEPSENYTDFNGGNGTLFNPYKISTKKQLNNIRNFSSSCFILTNDIEFNYYDFAENGDYYNDGHGWSPIGENKNSSFTGIFDGNGYVIKNICSKISLTDSQKYEGLFGYNGGIIKKLGIVGDSISVPYSFTSLGSNFYAGGIAGCNSGTITNCYNTCNVSESFSTTSSGINFYAGGITGYNTGTISNCYNTANVTSPNYAGGIVGCNYEKGTITNCYNTGSVTSSHYAGGIAGCNYEKAIIINCYYLDIIPNGVSDETDTCTKLTAEQMKNQSSFVGFDFDTVWEINAQSIYLFPTLKSVNHIEPAENNTDFNGGNGTLFNPYKISTKEQLNNVRKFLNSCFILTSDIEFSDEDFEKGKDFYNDGQGWSPIGANYLFTGIFDGNGHVIRDIYINIILNSSGVVYAGIFGINRGTIKNLGMVDSNVSGTSYSSTAYVGGIAGCNYGTITNCYNRCNIDCSYTDKDTNAIAYSGGITGCNCGTISRCYNTGKITSFATTSGYYYTSLYGSREYFIANSYSGGIVGCNCEKATITNCYNTGNVSPTSSFTSYAYLGGIAGYNYGTITNCYNTGSKPETSSYYAYLGGIAGYNYNNGTITNCYNTGSVTSSDYSYSGGIAGYNYNNGTITNCYNTGSVTSSDCSYSGGISGYNYNNGIITNCYNIGSVTSSDYSYSGGIAGCNYENGIIINCYNTGSVTSSDYVGGIAGCNYEKETITNCYYLDILSKGIGTGTDTCTKLTAEQMNNQSSFVGFNFENTWLMYQNYLPCLKSFENSNILSIKFEKSVINVDVNGKAMIPFAFNPNQIPIYNLNFYCLNNDIANVDGNGMLSGISVGNTYVIVRDTITNKTGMCLVTVLPAINSINITGEHSINYGEITKLTAIVCPSDVMQDVTWSSSSSKIATVNQKGIVYGNGSGTVTITATSNDGSMSSSKFTINVIRKAENIILDSENISLKTNESKKLNVTITPNDTTNKLIHWESSNNSVATVDLNGNVKAISRGYAEITATSEDGGFTAACQVEVIQPVTSLEISQDSMKIGIGLTQRLIATIKPDDANNQKVNWSSGDTDIATVDELGKVTGISNGITTILASSEDGNYQKYCIVSVEDIHAESIAIQQDPSKTEYLEIKDTLDLSGGKLLITYTDGTTDIISISLDMVTGFDNRMIGKQTLNVSYDHQTTTFEINIVPRTSNDMPISYLIKNNCAIIKCTDLLFEGKFIIPQTIDGYTVIGIDDRSFYNVSGLTSVVIPNTIRTIGDSSFLNCNSLSKIYYDGTKAEYNLIKISDGNNALESADFKFNFSYDANNDGVFDIRDLIHLKKTLAQHKVDVDLNPKLDFNSDGDITALDLVAIKKELLVVNSK